MYHAHWGLREPPFSNSLDPRRFYPNASHEEALARLHFLVDCQRRLGLLLGDTGCGKSFVLEVLADELSRSPAYVCKLSLLGLEPVELAWGLARGWGANPEEPTSAAQLWRTVADKLSEHRLDRFASVALLDDADEASPAVLNQIVRLVHQPLGPEGRLTIVLAARADRVAKLGVRLLELADLRIDVEPWESAETAGFVDHMLARAGRTAPTFTPDALERLHALGGGAVRNTNQMAELALLAAAGQGLPLVDSHTIESVCEELSVVATGA